MPPTLASAKAQTFRDFEHLIIDGASTDATVALASAEPGVRVISEPDRGLYDAMNKGLHLARGRYILFLNAGDALAGPDTLQRYADAIAAAPEAPGIVYGQTRLVDAERNYIGERHLLAPDNLNARSFLDGMVVCHQAMLVRRDLAPDYDLRYHFSADYDWGCKVLKASHLNIYIPGYVADYLAEGLTTANRRKSLIERFRAMSANYGLLPTILSHIKIVLHLR